MNELHLLAGNTYYIDGNTNIGVYRLNEVDVAVIDSGFKEMGPKIINILNEKKWNLKYLIITHSHADHSGSVKYLMDNTDCKVVTSKIERAFLRDNTIDLAFLSGGYPLEEYDNPLLHIDELKEIGSLKELPFEIEYFKLPGHHCDMVGFKTPDDVYFVADAVGNTNTLNKYHIILIYDLKGFLRTLRDLDYLEGKIVVPSHSEPTTHVKALTAKNREKIQEIIDFLLDILKEPHTHDEILKMTFDHFNLHIGYNQYIIAGSTIRGYLAYLSNQKTIKTFFKENRLFYQLKDYE